MRRRGEGREIGGRTGEKTQDVRGLKMGSHAIAVGIELFDSGKMQTHLHIYSGGKNRANFSPPSSPPSFPETTTVVSLITFVDFFKYLCTHIFTVENVKFIFMLIVLNTHHTMLYEMFGNKSFSFTLVLLRFTHRDTSGLSIFFFMTI